MKNKNMIIGGTGFIGYNLSKRLKKKNYDYSITKKSPKKKRKIKGVKYINCDIYKKNLLYKKLKPSNFDYVVNLGGNIDHNNKSRTIKVIFLDVRT